MNIEFFQYLIKQRAEKNMKNRQLWVIVLIKQFIRTSSNFNQDNHFVVIAVMIKAVELRDAIYQTRETVFHRDIQTPGRDLKI